MLSDFAMEYRTTHDKVQAKLERIKHEKERNKKRGKLIVSLLILILLVAHLLSVTIKPASQHTNYMPQSVYLYLMLDNKLTPAI